MKTVTLPDGTVLTTSRPIEFAVAIGPADPVLAVQKWREMADAWDEECRKTMVAIARARVEQDDEGWYLVGHKNNFHTAADSPDEIITAYLFDPDNPTETNPTPQQITVRGALLNYAHADVVRMTRSATVLRSRAVEVEQGNRALLGTWSLYRWCRSVETVDLVVADLGSVESIGREVVVLKAEVK